MKIVHDYKTDRYAIVGRLPKEFGKGPIVVQSNSKLYDAVRSLKWTGDAISRIKKDISEISQEQSSGEAFLNRLSENHINMYYEAAITNFLRTVYAKHCDAEGIIWRVPRLFPYLIPRVECTMFPEWKFINTYSYRETIFKELEWPLFSDYQDIGKIASLIEKGKITVEEADKGVKKVFMRQLNTLKKFDKEVEAKKTNKPADTLTDEMKEKYKEKSIVRRKRIAAAVITGSLVLGGVELVKYVPAWITSVKEKIEEWQENRNIDRNRGDKVAPKPTENNNRTYNPYMNTKEVWEYTEGGEFLANFSQTEISNMARAIEDTNESLPEGCHIAIGKSSGETCANFWNMCFDYENQTIENKIAVLYATPKVFEAAVKGYYDGYWKNCDSNMFHTYLDKETGTVDWKYGEGKTHIEGRSANSYVIQTKGLESKGTISAALGNMVFTSAHMEAILPDENEVIIMNNGSGKALVMWFPEMQNAEKYLTNMIEVTKKQNVKIIPGGPAFEVGGSDRNGNIFVRSSKDNER